MRWLTLLTPLILILIVQPLKLRKRPLQLGGGVVLALLAAMAEQSSGSFIRS